MGLKLKKALKKVTKTKVLKQVGNAWLNKMAGDKLFGPDAKEPKASTSDKALAAGFNKYISDLGGFSPTKSDQRNSIPGYAKFVLDKTNESNATYARAKLTPDLIAGDDLLTSPTIEI